MTSSPPLSHVPLYPSRRSPVFAKNMVAASHPLAAQAGLSMLSAGGNAVDAALATAISLTVVEPTGNGLGSDAFAILWDGTELHGLNASGRSPAAWTPDRFAGLDRMPFQGWESVTVPGAVSGWVALSERFGALPFERLFEPAVRYAEDGFAVTPSVAGVWAWGCESLHDKPGFAETFMPQGRPVRAGEWFRNRDLATSLRLIAETRGEAFYRGPLAEKIAAFARGHGAVLSETDLAENVCDWCGTLSQTFDDQTLHEIPPNGQGLAALMALALLDHTSVRDFGPDDPRAWHLMAEAMKLAFADIHAHLADPLAMDKVRAEYLLDAGYIADRAKLIDPMRATDHGPGVPNHGSTVCLAAADEDGRMVSFIQSNYAGFGSGVVVLGTGIHLQNRGAGFSLTPGHPNQVGPRKRPKHTIIPGFVTKSGQPHMAFGVMGGPMQPQGHVQMVLRTGLWGQNVQSAADAPRWRVTGGMGLALETSVPSDLAAALADLGHHITAEQPERAFGFGGAQLIAKNPGGGYVGGSDPRKDGHAVGF
ncbi:MAG: gamma-glutamyltransferase family protein [Pseudomonadota bacterium]